MLAAAWSPDGRSLACGAANVSVWLYDMTEKSAPRLVTTHWHAVRTLAFDEFIPGWEITGFALSHSENELFLAGSAGLCTIPLTPSSPGS